MATLQIGDGLSVAEVRGDARSRCLPHPSVTDSDVCRKSAYQEQGRLSSSLVVAVDALSLREWTVERKVCDACASVSRLGFDRNGVPLTTFTRTECSRRRPCLILSHLT